jgi:hypothetical protein
VLVVQVMVAAKVRKPWAVAGWNATAPPAMTAAVATSAAGTILCRVDLVMVCSFM